MYWSLTQADLARTLAIINMEKAKKSGLRSAKLDDTSDDHLNSVVYNETLIDLLKRPMSSRFDNYSQILKQGEDA